MKALCTVKSVHAMHTAQDVHFNIPYTPLDRDACFLLMDRRGLRSLDEEYSNKGEALLRKCLDLLGGIPTSIFMMQTTLTSV